jgi:hypothetical protein
MFEDERPSLFLVAGDTGLNQAGLDQIRRCATTVGIVAIGTDRFTFLYGMTGRQIEFCLLRLVAIETQFSLLTLYCYGVAIGVGSMAVCAAKIFQVMDTSLPVNARFTFMTSSTDLGPCACFSNPLGPETDIWRVLSRFVSVLGTGSMTGLTPFTSLGRTIVAYYPMSSSKYRVDRVILVLIMTLQATLCPVR